MKLHETPNARSLREVWRESVATAMRLSGNAPVDLGPAAPLPGPPAPAASPLREAAGRTVDIDDDGGWRRLTGRSDKDLDPVTQERALKLSQHLWESNPLANRLIELPLAYLLGKGVRLVAKDEGAQKLLDRHWKDSINAWPIKLMKRVRELALFGEQCWPVFVGGNGFVRVGYLDPKVIETVVMDPDNAEQPIGIVTKRDSRGDARRYRIIVNGPESVFTERTQAIRQTFTTGECFYFRVNDLCNGTRGRGDLVALLDWLDAYDEFLFGEMDRADFMRAFIWDVELTGANQDEVDARARKITAPRPGSVRVRNENEKWSAISPELQASDAATAARLFRNQVLGGRTVPEHWFGGGGDVNRSTGESMAEPTEKEFEARQAYIGHMLTEVGTYVLRAAWGRLGEDLDEAEETIIDDLRVDWPEMVVKDITRYASALQSVIAAAAQAIDEGLITRQTALSIIAAIATQFGVEIDVGQELEQAANALAEAGRDRTLDGFDLDDPDARPPAQTPPVAGDE